MSGELEDGWRSADFQLTFRVEGDHMYAYIDPLGESDKEPILVASMRMHFIAEEPVRLLWVEVVASLFKFYYESRSGCEIRLSEPKRDVDGEDK